MKHRKIRRYVQLVSAVVICVLASITASAQPATSVTGKYEGTAKGPNGELRLKMELKDEAGKISGQITSPNGVYNIVKGQMADGVLTIEAEGNGSKGKMTLRPKDDVLAGEFTADGRTGPVEFKKAAKDEISGEWEAVADAQGQPFPFILTLKLDGEKVTGSSSSQLGVGNIRTGSWKDGKLAIMLEGNIALMATMIEGKLSGDFDYGGRMSGKWVAMKKQ